jgi:hypothetical protein
MKKMIKIELMRYEAIKEILPDKVKIHIEAIEKEAIETLKDFALEIIKDNASSTSEGEKKETKKVKVNFS